MIEDIRWVERTMDGNWKYKVLQAYDGYVWFDVPVVHDTTP